ncbi:S1 family peptidase [Glycomyces buryatensis]|nr:S1 family peptidase [Glycomyces buryatensis]
MKRQRALAVTAAGALLTAAAFTFATSASADPLDARTDEARADLLGNVTPEVIDAMSESFGLTESEVYDRLAVEDVAADLLASAPESYEDSFAGVWVADAADAVMVATTSEADAADLEAEGATPVLVEHDLAELESAAASLAEVTTDGVYGNYVDVKSNEVVLEAADEHAASEAIEAAGVDADLVAVDLTAEAPQTFDVVGGDAYMINSAARCSVGFAVTQGDTGGFVSAGHCGSPGDSVSGNIGSGSFQESEFPGSDMSWVTASTAVTNTVNGESGTVEVNDSEQAAIGSAICRSGSTTGWHCGTVEAFDQTVNYAEGTVNGLTQTTVCAEPGDSGGSYISGNSAQGMTSGGSGDCSSGGTTFFQPIGPALDAWGLTLVTS